MRLDPTLRRLSAYLYVQDLLAGTVVELGSTDPRTAKLLAERGAQRVEQRASSIATGLPDASADAVLALDVDAADLDGTIAEAKRLLTPTGVLVLGCESRDRPGAKRGVSYYDLADRMEAELGAVTIVGQAPFVGATLVEYGLKDPEPMLDGTLVPKGERVEWYLAVASAEKRSTGGFAVVQLPLAELPRETAPAPAPKAEPPKAPPPPAESRPKAPAPPTDPELRELLRQREKGIEELRSAILKHAQEMDKVRAELRERDAYIAELERDAREAQGAKEQARRAEARAQAAEAAERKARLKLAESEGRLLRAGPSQTPAPPPAAPRSVEFTGDAGARIAELEAECARLRQKEADARAEAWKALKARSDAEAQAAEVREDTVRKLKDARKLASVELMRAMEEATKKAVSLRDELGRSERERKELKAEVERLRAELEAMPGKADGGTTPARQAEGTGDAPDAAVEALRGRVVALERELEEARAETEGARERAEQLGQLLRRLEQEAADGALRHGVALDQVQAERERLGRMLAEVEREAKQRAEAAVRMRQLLKEREHEVELLRRELQGRDARLVALEKGHPPAEEIGRMEAELGQVRARLADLLLEMQRKEAQIERAAAAAAHERARAERLVAEERRAIGDRNEARARAAEAESRAAQLAVEVERLGRELERAAERVREAENEARERKERVKQLKRELEAAEGRAQAQPRVDDLKVRLAALEGELRGESQRLRYMEDALRRAAEQANGA